jgi:hypothetical protein
VSRRKVRDASQREPEPWNREAEISTALRSVTRRRLVKKRQTEKAQSLCTVCELVVAL